MRTGLFLLSSFTLALMTTLASAAITLAPVFSDGAVLQRDKPVPVWGRAAAGEKITVSFGAQVVRTTTAPDGRWIALLEPMPASAEPVDLVVSGRKETVLVKGVLVGEVWLLSGQSNMEWPVAMLREDERKLAAVDLPLVRQLKIERAVAGEPAETAQTGGWQPASRDKAGDFSAIGYFFARDLHRRLGVPVGIINSSWGGTEIEAWMSDVSRQSTSVGVTIDVRWQQAKSEWPPERVARYPADMEAWQKAEEQARATKTKNPLPWPQPPASDDSPRRPGGLYNAMIAPLRPCALRGVVWYQGESNVGRAAEYAELFPAMIRAWRANWGDEALPFLFVQIPNYADGNPGGRQWARLREAQTRALDLPNTGMAVAIDVGDPDDIHPKSKTELARRLAQLAKVQVYGIPGDAVGPMFAEAVPEGTTPSTSSGQAHSTSSGQARSTSSGHARSAGSGQAMRVRFTHAGGGLVARGQPVQSLELAGPDKVFYAATAKIDRGTLIVTSPKVKQPIAVRYAWSNAPVANLYDGAGLPVAPFRSDDW